MEKNNQAELFKLCPNCGAKCKSVYQYCNDCGAALESISSNQADISSGISNEENGASFTPATPIPPKAEVSDTTEPTQPTVETAKIKAEAVSESENTTAENITDITPVQAESAPFENNQTYQYTPPEKEPIMNHFFNGVSAEDMFNYTGKKPKLYGYLQRQQMAPMNKIFCLPLFLLGLFFGFFGMACWYIYHKLYKQAALFFGLTLFFYIVNIAGAYSVLDAFTQTLSQLLMSSSAEPTEQEIIMMLQTILKGFPVILNALSYLGNLAQLVLAIVMPFYAYNTYRLTAIDRIKKARSTPFPQDISSIGGTAKGLLALAIGIGIIIIIIATVVLMVPIFDMVLDLLAESPEIFEDVPATDFGMYGEYIY